MSKRTQSIKRVLWRYRPRRWILWHPHQGLYNWGLVKLIQVVIPFRSAANLAIQVLIFLDTTVLLGRALGRRMGRLGIMTVIGRRQLPKGASILYLDLGTHKDARELALMANQILPELTNDFQVYGFEASEGLFRQAGVQFCGRSDVHLVHAAVCHVVPSGGKLKLFKDSEDGLENSVYRSQFADYEEVNAIRLSDWLREQNLDLRTTICLLRMNIEGSEFDVIMDLVESGLAGCIDGYFGMWDDISKIDRRRDAEF